MAAISAAMSAATHGLSGAGVVLLEGTHRLGTKILMSGGTRCNVTHDFVEPADYFGGSRNVVARLLREFSHEDARRFFEEDLHVALKCEETGKLFPVTDDAVTVRDALVQGAEERGVEIRLGRKVTAIERTSGGRADAVSVTGESAARFSLISEMETIEARSVILTTGGLSFPRTGSDGTGYRLARALGHGLTPATPALTPLVARGDLHTRLKGETLPVELTVKVNGKRVWRGTGSFLFTHFGYSGPVALDASRHVVRAPIDAGGAASIIASFLPGERAETMEAALAKVDAAQSGRTLAGWLRGRLPESVGRELLAEAGVPADRSLARLPREERRAVARLLTEFELPVLEVMGYRKAEVTAGGVPIAEVDPSTLESRIVPGLYLAGEILDVDGRLGGYNFQLAWSTGWIAGKAAARFKS